MVICSTVQAMYTQAQNPVSLQRLNLEAIPGMAYIITLKRSMAGNVPEEKTFRKDLFCPKMAVVLNKYPEAKLTLQQGRTVEPVVQSEVWR